MKECIASSIMLLGLVGAVAGARVVEGELHEHDANASINPGKASSLPKVLIIGDSISLGYTALVRSNLNGIADVSRPPVNCQHTGYGIGALEQGAKARDMAATDQFADLLDALVAVTQQVGGDVYPPLVPVDLRRLAVFPFEKHAQPTGRAAALPAEFRQPPTGMSILVDQPSQFGHSRWIHVRALIDRVPNHIAKTGLYPHSIGRARVVEGRLQAHEFAFPA